MPAFALAALPAAYIARITRASMLEVLRQDYVRTARAKGIKERVVLVRHILRNALIPVLTVAGPELAPCHRFIYYREPVLHPGIGRLFVKGVFQGLRPDYGQRALLRLCRRLVNLVVDIFYGAIDPA